MVSKSMDALPDAVTLRPRSGMLLTGVIAALALAGIIAVLLRGDWQAVLRYGLLAVVAVYGTWLLFWYPSVEVDPGGITVRNVLRTFRVQWPALVAVETRYALTLHTLKAKVVAWSAPAPSRYAAGRSTSVDVRNLEPHASSKRASVPLGDIPDSSSGLAAWHVRRMWAALRDAGYLNSRATDGTGVTPSWNLLYLTIGVAGLALALVVAAAL